MDQVEVVGALNIYHNSEDHILVLLLYVSKLHGYWGFEIYFELKTFRKKLKSRISTDWLLPLRVYVLSYESNCTIGQLSR